MKKMIKALCVFAVAAVGLAIAPTAFAVTYVVNSSADAEDYDVSDGVCRTESGACTLRAAVEEANYAGDYGRGLRHTILVPVGTYELTRYHGLSLTRSTGAKVEIVGDGTRSTVIVDRRSDRDYDGIFEVTEPAELTLRGLTLRGGRASRGGAILSDYRLALFDVALEDNSAGDVGGALATWGTVELENVTISGNAATYGGGAIAHFSGSLRLRNVTLSGNTAAEQGGALWNNGTATLTHVTFAGNAASSGAAIAGSGSVSIANSIVAAPGTACAAPLASITSMLATDASCGAGMVDDPGLDTLADNGGPTNTHALLAGSAALDAGSAASCLLYDQRGVARPQGSACDLGAYEREFAQPEPDVSAPTISLVAPTDGTVYRQGESVTAAYSCEDEAGGSGLAACEGTVASGAAIPTSTVGSQVFTVVARDNAGNERTLSVGYTVQARDTAAPVITTPGDLSRATRSNGLFVTYDVSAVDGTDGPVPVACVPESGAWFTVGTTTVACTAHDAAGNVAKASFSVTVVSAAQLLDDLQVATIAAFPRSGKNLNVMLVAADVALHWERYRAACAILGAYGTAVLVTPGQATLEERLALAAKAASIAHVLGCL